MIQTIIDFFSSPMGALVFAALWAISEVLASVPAIAANSIFQAIRNGIAWLVAKFPKK